MNKTQRVVNDTVGTTNKHTQAGAIVGVVTFTHNDNKRTAYLRASA